MIIFFIALLITIVVIIYIFCRKTETENLSKENTNINKINTSNIEKPNDSEYLKKKPLFIKIWDFKEFCKMFDSMQYGNPTNGITGEKFKSCRFYKEGKLITYVGFYKIPGELSLEELKKMNKELKVGLKENGRYLIYTGGMPYTKESEPIDLGI